MIAELGMSARSVQLRIETRGILLLAGSLALLTAGLIRVDGTMAALGSGGLVMTGIAALVARGWAWPCPDPMRRRRGSRCASG